MRCRDNLVVLSILSLPGTPIPSNIQQGPCLIPTVIAHQSVVSVLPSADLCSLQEVDPLLWYGSFGAEGHAPPQLKSEEGR